jgi:hypothetical protein
LWKRFTEATAEFFAPDETLALVAPKGLWAREDGLWLVDGEGYSLRLASPPPPYPDFLSQAQTALAEHPVRAILGRLTFQDSGVVLSPLSLLTDRDVVKLVDVAV